MLKIDQYGKFKPSGKVKNKTQIILCHSSREADQYLASLQFRNNGKFRRIPHFFITKKLEILQFLTENTYSDYFYDTKINEQSIIVVLENLGWLEKKPLSNDYINWNGSIYSGKVFEKKWRDYFFWEPYPEEQVEILSELCYEICNRMNINKTSSGHNTKIDGIKNFHGIVSKSNFDSRFTDLNPSFNFEKLIKNVEHERIS